MSRRKQAEEEYHLIKNLSQSIANKHKTKRNDTIYEDFWNYVAKALSELDKVASNLAQNKINNIIFRKNFRTAPYFIMHAHLINYTFYPLSLNTIDNSLGN